MGRKKIDSDVQKGKGGWSKYCNCFVHESGPGGLMGGGDLLWHDSFMKNQSKLGSF